MTEPTSLADRYRVEGELGRGGMATVWRAHDLRHDRRVAIKVLDERFAAMLGPERFLREIVTAARLQHPHIVPVFDSGEDGGRLFYVMPLIEGESLRSRLEREKRLDPAEAVTLAREVADALDYAHGQGVIHRDIKPENILLSRGHALLADFGIARASSLDPSGRLTEVGVSLGTPAYISPEQATGSDAVGPAADVYSLGCVLFELIAGELPFQASTAEAMLIKRFTESAPRLRSRRRVGAPGLDTAVARALAREVTERYSTAAAFAEALAPAGPRVLDRAGDRSIVVVPFDNLSPDPQDAYLADGLSEEIIADLSKVESLRVIARNSAVAARQRTRDLKEMAKLLDVRYLLEGSVRRAGNALRITAQLIDGTTDSHLWAEKYSGTMDDVFGMQERIARAIVAELKAKLTPVEDRRLASRTIASLPVLEAFLRARRVAEDLTLESVTEARRIIHDAVGRFGDHEVFSVLSGTIHSNATTVGLDADPATPGRILAAADQALHLNPESAAALALKAVHYGRAGDIRSALRYSSQAVGREFAADAAFVHGTNGATVGFDDVAMAWLPRAVEADPFNTMGMFWAGCAACFCGEVETGLRWSKLCLEANRSSPMSRVAMFWALVAAGNEDEALVFCEPESDAIGFVPEGFRMFGRAIRGKVIPPFTPEAQGAIWNDNWHSTWAAEAFAKAGDRPRALEYLRNATGLGFVNWRYLSERSRWLAPLRGEPEFQELMAEARVRQAEIAADLGRPAPPGG
jgi:serine/threonine-protein kinase